METDNQSKPFRNLGVALLAIWMAIVFYCMLYQVSGVLTIHDFTFNPWGQIKGETFYTWTPWLFMAPIVHLIAIKFPIRPDGGIKIILQHLLLMSLLALLHAYVASITYYSIGAFDPGMEAYEAWQHTGHYLFTDDIYLIDCFVYCVLMASISLKRFYELARQKELDSERAETQLLESQLQALKMQVNPHFLFNTLNSICVLIRKSDSSGAEQMINRLSDFFRLTLDQGHEQLVTVSEELKLIEQYLEIEKIRFGKRLTVEYLIDENCRSMKIPVLLLQPLVENAIKHGLGKKTGDCTLQIIIANTEHGMRIKVIDDGAGNSAKPEQRKGVGLANIQSRLAALYANNAHFSFTSELGKGAIVNIFLPAHAEYSAQT